MLDEVELRSKKTRAKKEPVQEEKSDIRLKYSIAELPSNGKLGYSNHVEYRDILVRDEKELASSTEKTFQKTLNSILKSLLKDGSYYDSLSIYDRDYLLLWIWANNYSTEKNIEATCPHCGHKNNYVIDLTALEVTELSEDFKNPYPFTLSNGTEVTLRLITVGDEEIARKYCAVNKEEEEYQVMLALSVNFGAVMPLVDKIKRINDTFTGKDMAFIRGFHTFFRYGVVDKVEKECSNCSEVSSYTVPFQADFVLPTLSSSFGKTI